MSDIVGVRFIHHPAFVKELDDFVANHCSGLASAEITIGQTEKLLFKQIFEKETVISAKQFGRAEGFGAFEVYWLHMIVADAGLTRTQYPKAYIYRQDDVLSILCCGNHIDNYKDEKLRKIANARLQEIIEVIKAHECS